MPKTPNPPTRTRHLRVSDQLWDDACARAESEGATISEILRELLRGYVRDGRRG